MAYIVMAYIVMAYIVMAVSNRRGIVSAIGCGQRCSKYSNMVEVMALYSYGLHSYGLYGHGLYSYGCIRDVGNIRTWLQ